MNVLVINTGSSSLKYDLFSMDDESVLFSGRIDGIGLDRARHRVSGKTCPARTSELRVPDQTTALSLMLEALQSGCIQSLKDIDAAAHRVAHAGAHRQAAVITPEVIAELKRMIPFVPLHLPAMISEIELCRELMPDAVHVAVNDAWFHTTMPDEATLYGLPLEYFEKKGYRRVGYHGFSHAYVAQRAAAFLARPLEDLDIITCHLGNGSSLCAISGGKSVDTTLGMSALEGLIMGTRAGDVDPGLIPVIMKEESLSPDQALEMLYTRSGLLGLRGLSRNMQDIEAAMEQGNARAALAFKTFCHRLKRYIGAMLMILGRCDVLVFTGGIGENSPRVRSCALQGASELGFVIDEERNFQPTPWQGGDCLDLTAGNSRTRILAIQTFEELIMARQCAEIVNGLAQHTSH
ncbi:MAG: acetate/propionate family kinase [Desulfomonilaceae bacterium]